MGTIGMEDFAKLEIRVGKVVRAERLRGSEKLLQVTLDMGGAQRTVVAGIAQTHRPEDLLGKNLVVLANLAPRKLMGVTSEGMILAAEDRGNVFLLTTDGDAPPGSKVL